MKSKIKRRKSAYATIARLATVASSSLSCFAQGLATNYPYLRRGDRFQPIQRRTICHTTLSMMKGSVFCATSLDGYIATVDGDISFLNDNGDGEAAPPSEEESKVSTPDPYSFENFLKRMDVMIMGRKTFDKVLSFGKDMWAYGDLRIVVWTRQEEYAIPEYLQKSVTCSNLSPKALWEDLQQQGYQNAYIDGGATISAFETDSLIEDWIVTRVPVVLGGGIPLFAPHSPRKLKFSHIHTQSMPSGLVTSHYRLRRDEAS